MNTVKFNNLKNSDLIKEKIYHGGNESNLKSEPISKLLSVGNSGGFRYRVDKNKNPYLCILFTKNNKNELWPDEFIKEKSELLYYGDNKKYSTDLGINQNKGNKLLTNSFSSLYFNEKIKIPLFFIFEGTGVKYDVRFKGLAVPKGKPFEDNHNLIGIWKTANQKRIFNYLATFSILNDDIIYRKWIDEIIDLKEIVINKNTPNSYKEWLFD